MVFANSTQFVPMQKQRSHGFTMMELLVAIMVSGIFTGIIGVIFHTTNQATRQGIAATKFISTGRTINELLKQDAQYMIGPAENGTKTAEVGTGRNSGGILIIVNHQIGDWDGDGRLYGDDIHGSGYRDHVVGKDELNDAGFNRARLEGVRMPLPNSQEEYRFVRSDQLTFIRQRTTDDQPLTPNETTDFTPYSIANTDPYPQVMRVWYGHVVTTDDDGTDANRQNASAGTADINRDFALSTSSGFLGRPGAEENGTTWSLGRQALFLMGDINDRGRASAPILYALSANANAAINPGAPSPPDNTYTNIPSLPPQFSTGAEMKTYLGLTDIANTSFDANVSSANSWYTGSLVHYSATPGGAYPPIPYNGQLGSDLSVEAYRQRAIEYHTFVPKRLRANPLPTLDAWGADRGYDAFQFAQMHPIIANNISDFTVEFAADLTNEDTSAGGTITGINDIRYHLTTDTYTFGTGRGHDQDGKMDYHGGYSASNPRKNPRRPGDIGDVDVNGIAYDAIPRGIKWYTARKFANCPGYDRDGDTLPDYDSTKPLTFPVPVNHPAYIDNPNLPAQLSPFVSATDITANFTQGFVWRHDDDSTDITAPGNADGGSLSWPYLLRISYRVHDPAGRIMSSNGQHGRWFEHIIPVSR